MRALVFCTVVLLLQGCATKPATYTDEDHIPLHSACAVGHRLYEIELLNKGEAEKAKRLIEMDINALLVVLSEYDKAGRLYDETKDAFEEAKAYRRDHPFKVSEQDAVDFPYILFNADEIVDEIIRKR